MNKIPGVEAQRYQRTVYNGSPQPVQYRFSGTEMPLSIIYFDSAEACEQEKDGTTEAPSEGGSYFVRIKEIAANEAGAGDTGETGLIIEYHIEPKELHIIAEDRQEAVYNGNPKRVKAEADAPVRLSYSYFPSMEVMRMVLQNAETPQEQRATATKGLTRVERPPIEPGTYYVLVHYSGDNNYQSAKKEIVFTIKNKF